MDLAHMNGRFYDPVVGRFPSADPLVQAPYDPQALNRYSYVRNNPLRYTDPSGYAAMELAGISVTADRIDAGAQALGDRNGGSGDAGGGLAGAPMAENQVAMAPVVVLGLPALDAAVTVATGMTVGALIGSALDVLLSEEAEEAEAEAEEQALDKAKLPEWSVPKEVIDKIPGTWGPGRPNRKGEGQRWADPSNKGNRVRVDKGNPDAEYSSQKTNHVQVKHNGRVIGRDGKPISRAKKDNPDKSHVPIDEYKGWKDWFRP